MSNQMLPRGMRNLNPGNLRKAYGAGQPTVLNDGFAVFKSLDDGLLCLCRLTFDYYSTYNLKTIPAFVSRYAPASENDCQAYTNAIADRLGVHTDCVGKYDTRLDLGWRALDFMRAIVMQECGQPNGSWPSFPEYVSPSQWVSAMSKAGRWAGL